MVYNFDFDDENDDIINNYMILCVCGWGVGCVCFVFVCFFTLLEENLFYLLFIIQSLNRSSSKKRLSDISFSIIFCYRSKSYCSYILYRVYECYF